MRVKFRGIDDEDKREMEMIIDTENMMLLLLRNGWRQASYRLVNFEDTLPGGEAP